VNFTPKFTGPSVPFDVTAGVVLGKIQSEYITLGLLGLGLMFGLTVTDGVTLGLGPDPPELLTVTVTVPEFV
jgi:hypothetical protein